MSRFCRFPFDPQRECDRLQAMYRDHLNPKDLDAELGSPQEWLATAVIYLKTQIYAADPLNTGKIPVSVAAVSLILQRLEKLEQGGQPWRGNPA